MTIAHRWFKNGDHPADYAEDRLLPDDSGTLLINGVRARLFTGDSGGVGCGRAL